MKYLSLPVRNLIIASVVKSDYSNRQLCCLSGMSALDGIEPLQIESKGDEVDITIKNSIPSALHNASVNNNNNNALGDAIGYENSIFCKRFL
jgi:hypothetical protein